MKIKPLFYLLSLFLYSTMSWGLQPIYNIKNDNAANLTIENSLNSHHDHDKKSLDLSSPPILNDIAKPKMSKSNDDKGHFYAGISAGIGTLAK